MLYRYEDLFGRNFPVIDEEVQKKIRTLKVAIIGVGALSFTATYLARIGVETFFLIDGDRVGLENVNHQDYGCDDLGKNKAEALKEHLMKINPGVKVTALSVFLTKENFEEIWRLLSDIDILVDGIDPIPGIELSRELAEKCAEKGILYLYPLDLGNGAVVFTNPKEFLKTEGESSLEILMNLIQELEIPMELKGVLEKVINGELTYYPQTIIAAVSASLLVTSIVLQWINGRTLPSLIYVDTTENIFYIK
jgi:hypothetical protein